MIQVTKLPFIIFLFMSLPFIGQEERVLITEEKNGKRTVLFAENTSRDTLNVFLMINAEGYRRSASQPQLRDLPPNSRTPMITIIERADVPSHYTYELIVNEKKMPIKIARDKTTIDIESIITGKLVIFTEDGCEKCDLLNTVLISQRVQFRNFDIGEDPVLYEQFIAFVNKKFPSKTIMRLPVIWNKDHVIFGFDELSEIMTEIIK